MEYEEKEPDDNKSVSNNSMHSVQGRRQRFARYIKLFLDKYCIITNWSGLNDHRLGCQRKGNWQTLVILNDIKTKSCIG